MAVKLRLMRMGKKKQPTYRVVAADARSPRDGRFIEIVGTYQPRQDPSVISIDNERAVHWLRHGAQPTERVEKLLKISGAWETFTGKAAPPVITTAASSIDEPAEAAVDTVEPETDTGAEAAAPVAEPETEPEAPEPEAADAGAEVEDADVADDSADASEDESE